MSWATSVFETSDITDRNSKFISFLEVVMISLVLCCNLETSNILNTQWTGNK